MAGTSEAMSVVAFREQPAEAGARVQQSPRLKIALCDYSGHPFQLQLSRALARRGHEVLHLHFLEFQTPKGLLSKAPDDPENFQVEAVSLGRRFAKHKFVLRRAQEIEVGARFAARISAFAPDTVVGCNLPLDALSKVMAASRAPGVSFVFWQQDIYSVAIAKILAKKLGFLGMAVGAHYRAVERRALLKSDAVVAISPDFVPELTLVFGVDPARVHVIENWAPLEEIRLLPKDNAWSRALGLHRPKRVLYTGTLGMKHDPALLLRLARTLEKRTDAALIVTSEGPAAEWLKREGKNCPALCVMPFQPYAVYPSVLASADVLVSILEPDAAQFSVPSKVLSYLCAGRPIVLHAPPMNLASRILAQSGAGYVASDDTDFLRRVLSLLNEPNTGLALGAAARRYAESHFEIEAITDRFETVLRKAHQTRLNA